MGRADLFADMNPGHLAETKLPDYIQPKKENNNIADMYWSDNEPSLLPLSPSRGKSDGKLVMHRDDNR